MKKLFLLVAVITILLSACNYGTKEAPASNGEYVVQDLAGRKYKVTTIDSCEYILDGNRMAHRGQCKFCEIRRLKSK